MLPAATLLPRSSVRGQFTEIYARQSGRDLSSMHFYMTFAYFKLAVILQQIYVRWKRGQIHHEMPRHFRRPCGQFDCLRVQLMEKGAV